MSFYLDKPKKTGNPEEYLTAFKTFLKIDLEVLVPGNILDFVERFYNRIIELHLHDGKYPRIDHKPLGTYKLPTIELLTKLNKKNLKDH